jgi:uncharacterized protein YcbX
VPVSTSLPVLANIRLHPIKSLDPVCVVKSRISPSGGLARDRVWALYSVDGKWVNGKRTALIHHIRAKYSPEIDTVTLSVPADRRRIPARTFGFPSEHDEAAEWFSVFFEQQIIVRYSKGGFPDDPIANGPTVVSTASLQAVAGWFPGLTLESVRLRFRASLEIDDVPAFWEDQLFGQNERSVVRFSIGEVHMEGSNPCARCPVPPRDPCTGANLDGFQKHFARQREATLPSWSPRERFDHFYKLTTNTRVASAEDGKFVRVGDTLALS